MKRIRAWEAERKKALADGDKSKAADLATQIKREKGFIQYRGKLRKKLDEEAVARYRQKQLEEDMIAEYERNPEPANPLAPLSYAQSQGLAYKKKRDEQRVRDIEDNWAAFRDSKTGQAGIRQFDEAKLRRAKEWHHKQA